MKAALLSFLLFLKTKLTTKPIRLIGIALGIWLGWFIFSLWLSTGWIILLIFLANQIALFKSKEVRHADSQAQFPEVVVPKSLGEQVLDQGALLCLGFLQVYLGWMMLLGEKEVGEEHPTQ